MGLGHAFEIDPSTPNHLLHEIDKLGLFKGLEAGLFADIKRSPERGRGLEGVIKRNERFFNPFF